MSETQVFFYWKDVATLIEQATSAGGNELGIVITLGDTAQQKPQLKVGYFVEMEKVANLAGNEHFTGSTDGCPYPPRCL